MSLNRRELIQRGAMGAGLVVAGNLGSLFPGVANARGPLAKSVKNGARVTRARAQGRGYGRLVADPDKLLDLPDGFTYRIISEAGKPTTDGGVIPDRFDGTGLIAADGRSFLVRNSEQGIESTFAAKAAPEFTYDPAAEGGTTTVELDADMNVIAEYVSLAGTVDNCAGGLTPWGTWLTCEETEDVTGDDGYTKDHGFVFEVDPVNTENNQDPTPLTALGRFKHEAVAVDPTTGVLYLTEDASAPNGLLYRATPAKPLGGYGSLRAGAVLEALVATDGGSFVPDLSEYTEIGATLTAGWTEVLDPLATEDSIRVTITKVTRSRKLEGAWWGNDAAYFACSYARLDDGSVAEHDGQVWKLDPVANTIELVVAFGVNPDPESDNFDGPDNITVAPWGGLILCSDGEGYQHLWTVAADGTPSMFGRNARDEGEFTGATFSADGSTLFANLQEPGVTFSITGPW